MIPAQYNDHFLKRPIRLTSQVVTAIATVPELACPSSRIYEDCLLRLGKNYLTIGSRKTLTFNAKPWWPLFSCVNLLVESNSWIQSWLPLNGIYNRAFTYRWTLFVPYLVSRHFHINCKIKQYQYLIRWSWVHDLGYYKFITPSNCPFGLRCGTVPKGRKVFHGTLAKMHTREKNCQGQKRVTSTCCFYDQNFVWR